MNNKTALVIQHVAFEDLGSFEPVLTKHGYHIEYLEAATADLPQLATRDPDVLVILGGPIGAYEDDVYPFLKEELRLIEQRLQSDRPLLGICLGSQLMARALGARVYPGHGKEIGWKSITLTPPGRRSCLRHLGPKQTTVFHWHGDTFDLPSGATRLASTEIYENQAFSWGRRALALQFHPEVTAQGLERWFIGHAAELASIPGVSVSHLRDTTVQCAPRLLRQAETMLGQWLKTVDR